MGGSDNETEDLKGIQTEKDEQADIPIPHRHRALFVGLTIGFEVET